MPHDPRKCLDDILQAGSLIQASIGARSRDEYLNDLTLHAAVEREFEIIGEALNRLLKVSPILAQQIPEYRRIIAFRNILAHGYDIVDHHVVWLTITNKLPDLLLRVQSQLASFPSSTSQ